MERRTALALALSVTATVGAVGAAFAANLGLLAESDSPVGELQISDVGTIVTTPATPRTIVIDVPAPTAAGAGDDTGATVPTASGVGSVDDDHGDDDDHGHEDEHEDEDEGADDDD